MRHHPEQKRRNKIPCYTLGKCGQAQQVRAGIVHGLLTQAGKGDPSEQSNEGKGCHGVIQSWFSQELKKADKWERNGTAAHTTIYVGKYFNGFFSQTGLTATGGAKDTQQPRQ